MESIISGNRIPHASSHSIPSFFPPTKSHSGGSASNEIPPQLSLSVSSFFPPTKSHSGGSASNEILPQLSLSVSSFFPPTRSQIESSESNERLPQFSHSIPAIISPTQSDQTVSNGRLIARSSHFISSVFQPDKSDTTSSDSVHQYPPSHSIEDISSRPNTSIYASDNFKRLRLSSSIDGEKLGSQAIVKSIALPNTSNPSELMRTNIKLLVDPSCDDSDAVIVVEGTPVGVHRCLLGARSKFFHDLFRLQIECSDGKPKYLMNDLWPNGKVGYEAFMFFLTYLYTAKLKPCPIEVSTCVDNVCIHDSCRPAIHFFVQLMYASSTFQIPELVSHFQRRLLNFIGKALVEDVIPILEVAFHCQLNQLLDQCVERVARSDLDSISLEKELPHAIAERIKWLRPKSQSDDEHNMEALNRLREKRIRRIHKALDSDDVELVKLLLTESKITLDEAHALHYAVAYCDPKVVTEVLGLGLANVNLRNYRGYTVLHMAVMRKEPSIIVSLLTKGACALDLALDDQSAVSICRRLTRPKDYHAKTEQGQEANKDRICIDVLEREMQRILKLPALPALKLSSFLTGSSLV